MELNKPIASIKKDVNYTVIEFTDGSLLPLHNMIAKPSLNRCVFCNRHEHEAYLCSLDGNNYICKDCATQAISIFVKNGVTIDLNISEIAPKVAKQLKQFIETAPDMVKKDNDSNLPEEVS